ncbi:MAG: 3-deoxy-7-phosphoheptulonate synthase [Chloroflexi bacterium]|nr:3-deoxy-7-phosphoheptulonate synthase [Chloroflexota bacterium]
MIVVMRMGSGAAEVGGVIERICELGYKPHVSSGAERVIIGVIGNDRPLDPEHFISLAGVEKVVPILQPYKLASRDFQPTDTVIRVNDALIGGKGITFMAGPCSVESREQTFEVARQLKEMGVKIMRGGAFKPRTSPYSFQGLGEEALHILADVREELGISIITEVMAPDEVALVAHYADILQIGTRNMQNYRLLEEVGRQSKPVLIKRGMSSTIEELLLAAEYVLSQGNTQVMLCERGIRTFEKATRSTFDINAIPVLKSLTHLPVIADPSHGTGRWDLVTPVSLGAIAAGGDGLLIEVHSHPEHAMSDGGQSLRPDKCRQLLEDLSRVAAAVGRRVDLADGVSAPALANAVGVKVNAA